MRNFAFLTDSSPLKNYKGQCTETRSSPFVRLDFANEAHDLGLRNKEISQRQRTDPGMEPVKDFLTMARNDQTYNGEDLASIFRAISQFVQSGQRKPPPVESSMFSLSDNADAAESIEKRCGRVYQKAYQSQQGYLNLTMMLQIYRAQK
jgi:hypothetical protein